MLPRALKLPKSERLLQTDQVSDGLFLVREAYSGSHGFFDLSLLYIKDAQAERVEQAPGAEKREQPEILAS